MLSLFLSNLYYEQLMDDFEDVATKEKQFMKIWNRFIKSHINRADSALPNTCMEFVNAFSSIMIEQDLRQNFLLHLFNLWDESLLSGNGILACMAQYDSAKTAAV